MSPFGSTWSLRLLLKKSFSLYNQIADALYSAKKMEDSTMNNKKSLFNTPGLLFSDPDPGDGASDGPSSDSGSGGYDFDYDIAGGSSFGTPGADYGDGSTGGCCIL